MIKVKKKKRKIAATDGQESQITQGHNDSQNI